MADSPVTLDTDGHWHLGRAVTGIEIDSRRVQPGSVFVAIAGHTFDGHQFVDEAVRRGAIALVVEKPIPSVRVPVLQVPSTRRAAASLAATFHGFPGRRLVVTGVTGTNGKTSVVYWLRHLLHESGHPTGMLSSVQNVTGRDHEEDAHLTTPEALQIQRALAEMVDQGLQRAVVEVSSHGLVQHRVDDIDFHTAILTNITREHLDYHHTMDNYVAAKADLFTRLLNPEGTAVLNADDPYAQRILPQVRADVLTYGVVRGDVRARILEEHPWSTRIAVQVGDANETYSVEVPFPGRYNVYNTLAAWAGAMSQGVPSSAIAPLVASFPEVPGRLEIAAQGDDVTVLVDYAHTPDGLTQVLQTARRLLSHTGRLWLVFGARGGRDRGKRPIMGAVAARLADFIVLTADSPNLESAQCIARELEDGLRDEGVLPYAVELDRKRAIAQAVADALPGDVVLVTGRGPEGEQFFGHETIVRLQDRDAAAQAVRERLDAHR